MQLTQIELKQGKISTFLNIFVSKVSSQLFLEVYFIDIRALLFISIYFKGVG